MKTQTSINQAEFESRFPKLVSHMKKEEITVLLDSFDLLKIDADEILIKSGDSAQNLYFVWEGALTVFIENEQKSLELGHITQGKTIGEVALLDPGPATATVISKTKCTLLYKSSNCILL